MTELLPCPFCGGVAEYTPNSLHGDNSMATCRSCGAMAFWQKWNRRDVGSAQGATGNWDADCERIEKDFYAKVGRYCTFGPPAERKRQWIILFEDADRGVMVFDDEREAHTAWDGAKDNWTCTLYETSHRKFVFAAGQLRPLDELQTASRSPAGNERPPAPASSDGSSRSADIVDRLWTLVRHGRDQGMKMNDVEDAAREINRLRDQVEGARNSETIPVPKAALDWLFGEGKDSDGWGFGECRTAQLALNAKNPRRYWWRSKFRAMIPALRLSNTSTVREADHG